MSKVKMFKDDPFVDEQDELKWLFDKLQVLEMKSNVGFVRSVNLKHMRQQVLIASSEKYYERSYTAEEWNEAIKNNKKPWEKR